MSFLTTTINMFKAMGIWPVDVELRVKLGYTEKVFSFDKATIVEILKILLKELSLAENEKEQKTK